MNVFCFFMYLRIIKTILRIEWVTFRAGPLFRSLAFPCLSECNINTIVQGWMKNSALLHYQTRTKQ